MTVRIKLFIYYLVATFSAASLAYFSLAAIFAGDVFGGWYRMFMYHARHPYQYIAVACFVFSIIAALFTPSIAGLRGWRRRCAIVGLMLGSVVVASVPGGVLWSIHDMQAGYFPTGDRFWAALKWGATSGLQIGWLIIAGSIPYNIIGLVAGYFITEGGIRLAVRFKPAGRVTPPLSPPPTETPGPDENEPTPPGKIHLRNGDVLLVMVQDGEVIHHSWNMSLPHVEFVNRTTGTVPSGAWVGTVSKLHGEIMGITSKYFYDYQLPAPEDVDRALKALFE